MFKFFTLLFKIILCYFLVYHFVHFVSVILPELQRQTKRLLIGTVIKNCIFKPH